MADKYLSKQEYDGLLEIIFTFLQNACKDITFNYNNEQYTMDKTQDILLKGYRYQLIKSGTQEFIRKNAFNNHPKNPGFFLLTDPKHLILHHQEALQIMQKLYDDKECRVIQKDDKQIKIKIQDWEWAFLNQEIQKNDFVKIEENIYSIFK